MADYMPLLASRAPQEKTRSSWRASYLKKLLVVSVIALYFTIGLTVITTPVHEFVHAGIAALRGYPVLYVGWGAASADLPQFDWHADANTLGVTVWDGDGPDPAQTAWEFVWVGILALMAGIPTFYAVVLLGWDDVMFVY